MRAGSYNEMMSKPVNNPHDAFFRQLFSDQAVARDFVAQYLPDDVVPLLELASLTIHKDTFIDQTLQRQASDVLYEVKLVAGQTAYVYLLFEHKSYPDPQVAYQLLKYMVRIWEQDEKQQRDLRPIIPLVFYHGASEWQIAADFQSLLDVPEAMIPYVPQFRYWLYDLSQIPEQQIQGEVALRLSLLVLKCLQQPQADARFLGLIDLMVELSKQQRGIAQLSTLLRYVGNSNEDLRTETFIQVVDALWEKPRSPHWL